VISTSKPKPRTARQASRAAAAQYHAPQGETPLLPAICGPLRQGHAWDMYGNEVPLMQGRRWLRPVEKEDDEHEHA
jgi:hypothetical protein